MGPSAGMLAKGDMAMCSDRAICRGAICLAHLSESRS